MRLPITFINAGKILSAYICRDQNLDSYSIVLGRAEVSIILIYADFPSKSTYCFCSTVQGRCYWRRISSSVHKTTPCPVDRPRHVVAGQNLAHGCSIGIVYLLQVELVTPYSDAVAAVFCVASLAHLMSACPLRDTLTCFDVLGRALFLSASPALLWRYRVWIIVMILYLSDRGFSLVDRSVE